MLATSDTTTYNTNPINTFINKNYTITNKKVDKVKCSDLYSAYSKIDNLISNKAFVKQLIEMMLPITQVQVKGINYWSGIKINK